MAAHTGVEPMSSDRQSDIINRYTNEPLALGVGIEPTLPHRKCGELSRYSNRANIILARGALSAYYVPVPHSAVADELMVRTQRIEL